MIVGSLRYGAGSLVANLVSVRLLLPERFSLGFAQDR